MRGGTDAVAGRATGGEEESHGERVNRELIELLNELRVALPGVQVLFAFLLAVPFAQGFDDTTLFQRALFFCVLVATALSSALLIAPSAYHRVNFRERDKERLLLTANVLTQAGLAMLALAITGAVVLVADFIYGGTLALACAIAGLVVFAGLWLVLPVARRNPADKPSSS